jgi:serine phosphatase RsbU (regulator of sigma subunit)
MAPGAVVDVLSAAARDAGATDVVAFVVDFEQQVLEPLPDRASHVELPMATPVAGTMAGRAFLTGEAVTAERDDSFRVWVPIIEGSDRTGVLALTVSKVDDEVLEDCTDLGVLAGYLIATHTRCTDLYQLHRRRKAMTMAASMQWDLLPPLVLRTPGCRVAALLEPAYEVGGDCFDYAVNGDVVDLAVIDAMGHGVDASAIAALAIGCYRHGRREGSTPDRIHAALDSTLERQYGGDVFATGQLAQLALKTGELVWTSAGHPPPLLIRNGQVVKQLDSVPALPWGLGGPAPTLSRESLEPNDSVLFFTDGVVEARTVTGEEFGLDRLADLAGQFASEHLAPAEIVRQIVRSVLDHRAVELRDDATLLLVQWHKNDE